MHVGITGHQRLPDIKDWTWVSTEIKSQLRLINNELSGISSLAIGADQVFAQAVLDLGGILHVVLPFSNYETKLDSSKRPEFQRLLSLANKVEVLEYEGSDENSYLLAGKRIVDLSEIVFAVWDGKPAAGKGGTADVVIYAKQMDKKVIHLNPLNRKIKRINL